MALTLGRLFEGVEGGGRHLFDILAGEGLVRALALLFSKDGMYFEKDCYWGNFTLGTFRMPAA